MDLAALKEIQARFAVCADAVEVLEVKAKTLLAQADAYREVSSSLDHDNI